PRRMGATPELDVTSIPEPVSILSHPEGWEPLHHPKSCCDLEFFSRLRGLASHCPFRPMRQAASTRKSLKVHALDSTRTSQSFHGRSRFALDKQRVIEVHRRFNAKVSTKLVFRFS